MPHRPTFFHISFNFSLNPTTIKGLEPFDRTIRVCKLFLQVSTNILLLELWFYHPSRWVLVTDWMACHSHRHWVRHQRMAFRLCWFALLFMDLRHPCTYKGLNGFGGHDGEDLWVLVLWVDWDYLVKKNMGVGSVMV
jgi:hypothetical protein